jgi:hypothetical protein
VIRATVRHRFRLAASLAVLVLLCVAATPAAAEGESALERLTPEERAFVEKFPGWAELSEKQKEHLAVNAIRLRSLAPEDRARFMRRLQEVKQHRDQHGRLPEGFKRFRNPKVRAEMKNRGLLMRAVGATLWTDLPDATHETVKDVLGPRGRGRVEDAFFRRLWGRVAAKIAEAGVPAIEVAPDAPPPFVERLKDLRAKAEEGDEQAKLKLAHVALAQQSRSLVRELDGVDPDDEETLLRIGALIKAKQPEVYAAALAELQKAAGAEESLKQYAERGHRGRGPSRGRYGRDEPLRRLLHALEEARPLLGQDPELEEAAQRLERLVRKALGTPRRGGMRPGTGKDRRPRDGFRKGPGREPGGVPKDK